MWEAVYALLTNHPTMVDGAEVKKEVIVPLIARMMRATEKPAITVPVLSVLELMSKNDVRVNYHHCVLVRFCA